MLAGCRGSRSERGERGRVPTHRPPHRSTSSPPDLLARESGSSRARPCPDIRTLASSILIARFLSVDDRASRASLRCLRLDHLRVQLPGCPGSLCALRRRMLGRDELDTLRGPVWWTARINSSRPRRAGARHDRIVQPRRGALDVAPSARRSEDRDNSAGVLFLLRRWREASVITLVIVGLHDRIAVVLALGWDLPDSSASHDPGCIAAGGRAGWRGAASIGRGRGPVRTRARAVLGTDHHLGRIPAHAHRLAPSSFFFLERYASTKQSPTTRRVRGDLGLGAAVEALAGWRATVASLPGSGETARIARVLPCTPPVVWFVRSRPSEPSRPPLIRSSTDPYYARTGGRCGSCCPFPLLALHGLCGLMLGSGPRPAVGLCSVPPRSSTHARLRVVPHLAEVGGALATPARR